MHKSFGCSFLCIPEKFRVRAAGDFGIPVLLNVVDVAGEFFAVLVEFEFFFHQGIGIVVREVVLVILHF